MDEEKIIQAIILILVGIIGLVDVKSLFFMGIGVGIALLILGVLDI